MKLAHKYFIITAKLCIVVMCYYFVAEKSVIL